MSAELVYFGESEPYDEAKREADHAERIALLKAGYIICGWGDNDLGSPAAREQ